MSEIPPLADDRWAEVERELHAWLAWMREFGTQINPLAHELTMPANPKPPSEAIVPVMKRWNPNGPW